MPNFPYYHLKFPLYMKGIENNLYKMRMPRIELEFVILWLRQGGAREQCWRIIESTEGTVREISTYRFCEPFHMFGFVLWF